MYYIEFYKPVPGTSLETFHAAAASFTEWSRRFPEDSLIANIGRTWRIGPFPYALIWSCSGVHRLDEWKEIFTSGEVSDLEEPLLEISRAYDAGFYQDIVPNLPPPTTGPYYLEIFTPTDGIRKNYDGRDLPEGATLHLLLKRLEHLGPEPGGIALFSIARFDDIAALTDSAPREVEGVGLYENFGQEIL